MTRKTVFAVTERATLETLPAEKMVDTLCAMEDILGDIQNVMVRIHNEIKALRETAENGIRQSEKAMVESGWIRLHLSEHEKKLQALTDRLGERSGLSNKE